MSIRKARLFYNKLTPQQKHFVDNKTINTTMNVKHWSAFLRKASDFDEYVDKARKKLTVWLVLWSVALGASVILVIATAIFPVLFVSALLVIFIVSTVKKRRYFIKHDINNYMRLFFMPFLEAMRIKAGEDAKLSASLDFRDPMKSINPVKSENTLGSRTQAVSLYEHKVIIAGIQLLDSSYLETVLLDDIKQIKQQNARGKYKFKTKTLHRVFIRLSVSKQVYKLKEGISFPENVEWSEDNDAIIFKIKEKHKELSYDILTPAKFFASLTFLYDLLEPLTDPSTQSAGGQTTSGGQPVSGIRAGNLVEPLVWSDLLFNQYDYDSFSRSSRTGTHHHHGMHHHDESRNVFES